MIYKLPKRLAPTYRGLRKRYGKKFKAVGLRLKFHRKYYNFLLWSKNPRVNLANELCFMLNFVKSGRKPPRSYMAIEFKRPSGWKKLRAGYYVKSKREFDKTLRAFREKRYAKEVHAKKYRRR